ncbi:cytidine deaminase-like fold-containing protein [Achromobacter marplatensis]|uniref:cytidine deaminase-like fold-containing protein n=1 Tax=Achromobacter marplatensis TaxID=470868 RepID=UPI0039F72492
MSASLYCTLINGTKIFSIHSTSVPTKKRKGDIAAAAEKAGLKSLTVQAMGDVTGLPKKYNWVPGMRWIKEVP